VSRTRARCWCGRKFDPTRSLDGVSCHEHDADLTGIPEPDEAPALGSRRCTCDPWAPDEACPVHGDDEHRIVYLPTGGPRGPSVDLIIVDDPWSTPSDKPPPF
jgi:hypothetical protein